MTVELPTYLATAGAVDVSVDTAVLGVDGLRRANVDSAAIVVLVATPVGWGSPSFDETVLRVQERAEPPDYFLIVCLGVGEPGVTPEEVETWLVGQRPTPKRWLAYRLLETDELVQKVRETVELLAPRPLPALPAGGDENYSWW